jgi:hypothetical protein
MDGDGSAYDYPDAATIDAQNAGIDAEINRVRPQDTWLRRLAQMLAGPSQAQQAQSDAQQTTGAAGPLSSDQTPQPSVGSAGAPIPPPKAGQWMTQDPAAIGKAMHAQRQSAAVGSLAHSLGEIVKMAAGAYMGGGGGMMSGLGGGAGTGAAASAIPGETATGAATTLPAGTTETLTPGGTPATAALGGGSTGGGLADLARNYFSGGLGGGGGGGGISNLLSGGGGGGGMGGMGMSMAAGGASKENQAISDLVDAISGTTGNRARALAQIEGLGAGLTSTGGMPGGGSNIPWAT